ncbi:MAG: lipase family protein [Candidatus Peribacteraceae bacterium]|nr:lipase family protein [Candidatus Peribacteraceae bacterium]
MRKVDISAALCEWIYEDDFKEKCEDLGLDIIHIEDGKVKWAIIQASRCVYVVFRGTDNFSNWISNLKATPTYTKMFGWAHRGWRRAFMSTEVELKSQLTRLKKPDLYVIFCGHSMGGVVAQFAAIWHRKHYSALRCEVISFGAPKPGLGSFCERMERIPYTRYFNDDDPTPHSPGFLFYRHPKGNPVEVRDGDNDFIDAGEHNMKLYRRLACGG